MDVMEHFMQLYGELPRAGPGDNRSTQRAFGMIKGLSPEPRILDIGCGPGVQTFELAKLTSGCIVALDLVRLEQTVSPEVVHPAGKAPVILDSPEAIHQVSRMELLIRSLG